MSLQSVLGALKVWENAGATPPQDLTRGYQGPFYSVSPFPTGAKAQFEAVIRTLYEGSPTAASILESGAAQGDVWIFRGSPGSASLPGTRTVAIDLASISTLQYMGLDGQFQQERLEQNVIHELVHGILGLLDPPAPADVGPTVVNSSAYDHLGDTVRKQNVIAVEMSWGSGYQQGGYYATGDQYFDPRFFNDASGA